MTDSANIAADIECVPGWEKFPWLRAGFSTRLRGVSTVYNSHGIGELNLGWTATDTQEAVEENRRRFLAAVNDGSVAELVTIGQTHTDVTQIVRAGHGKLSTDTGRATLEGDGLATALPGLMLGVQTADCTPVLVADVEKRVVAAFHAGWRGTAARIVEQGIALLVQEYSSRPEDMIAAIGPAIGACCYVVGQDLRDQFDEQFPYAGDLFREIDGIPAPQFHLDLHEANRRQLLDAGLMPQQITVLGECTACTRTPTGQRKYFSHRDEKGFTGRMISAIGITG
ncbi:peptidoglycan editing factor PgeF [Granulicella cerasi]|uniref:Purine nucleoside phosphorylase n=1 Tax=Granulicella cerasi TaxID=741063 RepID=A0ABW1ZB82_9BACT|nr:peptidoglycan editing factor PgeF [Granulicella cerasi]